MHEGMPYRPKSRRNPRSDEDCIGIGCNVQGYSQRFA
jgi:hypothetical protein